MTDSPFIDDGDLPYAHNPIEYLPRINPQVQVQMFQLRAGLAHRLAEWCGGEVAIEDAQHVVLVPGNPVLTVRQSDWLATDGTRYWIEPHEDYLTRLWPVGRDPGWSHRCLMDWED